MLTQSLPNESISSAQPLWMVLASILPSRTVPFWKLPSSAIRYRRTWFRHPAATCRDAQR